MAEPIHASGFPGWGPPTLCGEPGPTPHPCGEVTCEKCIDCATGDGLFARVAALELEIGPPKVPPTLRLVRGGAA